MQARLLVARAVSGQSKLRRSAGRPIDAGWKPPFSGTLQFRCEDSLMKIEDKQARLGHVFDGIAQAFAAQAGVLYAAVWHVVDAK